MTTERKRGTEARSKEAKEPKILERKEALARLKRNAEFFAKNEHKKYHEEAKLDSLAKYEDAGFPLKPAVDEVKQMLSVDELKKYNIAEIKQVTDFAKNANDFFNDAKHGKGVDEWKKQCENFVTQLNEMKNPTASSVSLSAPASQPALSDEAKAHIDSVIEKVKTIESKKTDETLSQLAKSTTNEVETKKIADRAKSLMGDRLARQAEHAAGKILKSEANKKAIAALEEFEKSGKLKADYFWKKVDEDLSEERKKQLEREQANALNVTGNFEKTESIREVLDKIFHTADGVFKSPLSDVSIHVKYDEEKKSYSISPITPLPSGTDVEQAYGEIFDTFQLAGSTSITLSFHNVERDLTNASDLEKLYKIMEQAKARGLWVELPTNVMPRIVQLRDQSSFLLNDTNTPATKIIDFIKEQNGRRAQQEFSQGIIDKSKPELEESKKSLDALKTLDANPDYKKLIAKEGKEIGDARAAAETKRGATTLSTVSDIEAAKSLVAKMEQHVKSIDEAIKQLNLAVEEVKGVKDDILARVGSDHPLGKHYVELQTQEAEIKNKIKLLNDNITVLQKGSNLDLVTKAKVDDLLDQLKDMTDKNKHVQDMEKQVAPKRAQP